MKDQGHYGPEPTTRAPFANPYRVAPIALVSSERLFIASACTSPEEDTNSQPVTVSLVGSMKARSNKPAPQSIESTLPSSARISSLPPPPKIWSVDPAVSKLNASIESLPELPRSTSL